MSLTEQAGDTISFGRFNLLIGERLLTQDGVRVELGARALDILICLLSRPNEIVSKKALLEHVWPDVTVEETSLRFHMVSLRKALGDGKDGARYIATLPGRGYCFVAPVSRSGAPAVPQTIGFPQTNLPNRPTALVGREADVRAVSDRIGAARLVTVVGSGGVGKTTLAVAVGHQLTDTFGGAVLFVDLSMLGTPDLVATALSSMLGLSVQSEDPTPNLVVYLRARRVLVILDTCEHLIDAVASVASRILAEAPDVHILATSREPLQIDAEHVYRLDALACPPEEQPVTMAVARAFPATQLFFDRALASGARLEQSDSEAVVVAGICRRLDGVALAIEMAARRVEAYGLDQTAALLGQRLALSWAGPRTAPQRQKTLQATLDWSYGLLSEIEQLVLRRLAVFVGHFALDAALSVASDSRVDQEAIVGAIDSLVAKSMVATRPAGAMMRYRLLDTTRAYALEIPRDDGECVDLAVRHASYWRQWVERSAADWPNLTSGVLRAPYFAGLNNVRAALEWCFGPGGKADIGIGLAAAAAPAFLAMSLLTECRQWSERALLALGGAGNARDELNLQAALGVSLMFTEGNSERAGKALARGLAIAEALGDAPHQLKLLSLLHMYHHRIGDFNATLQYAKRGVAVSGTMAEPVSVALAHSLLGSSLHHVGDLAGARAALEIALQRAQVDRQAGVASADLEHYNYAGIALARTLWLQGFPDQAVDRVRDSLQAAELTRHPVPLSRALVWAISVFLWTGYLPSAEAHSVRLIAHAELHALGPYLSVGRGYHGVLDIRQGNAQRGVERLRGCLQELDAVRYQLLNTPFHLEMIQGLVAMERGPEALVLVNQAIERARVNGDLSNMPELLRVKGGVLRSGKAAQAEEAERCFVESIDWGRRQGAKSWELRSAVDLAAALAARGRADAARSVLCPIFETFTEGFDTADLKSAARLIASLESVKAEGPAEKRPRQGRPIG